MDTSRMAELLRPYMADAAPPPELLAKLQSYLDLLLRWNARMNLTAVRNPEEIVTRHFGESLFAAQVLLGDSRVEQIFRPASNQLNSTEGLQPSNDTLKNLADVGSGAGFPGIPMKLFAPELALTLIESQHKKATFLREVVRTLGLERVEVFSGRAEQWGKTADLVTLRAVERFERALPAAAKMIAAGGRLCLLIGTAQVPTAQELLGAGWQWEQPELVPRSRGRVVLAGSRR
jgi:16S rRNA (guanine527-N7)-methyltransferase